MIKIKNKNELEAMRIAGKKTASILKKVAEKVSPGVTTGDLDAYAAD